jgi:hypothetical protein
MKNGKLKRHDRFKVKLAKWLPGTGITKYRRWHMWARDNRRRKVPPETGYGVAYEVRHDL